MTTKLRALLEQAESDIDTYRHPNIAEAQSELNRVLSAAGLGSTGEDTITGITIGREYVFITTKYSVRSCEQSDSFELPIHLVDAEDPIQAALTWSIQEDVRKANNEVAEAEAALAQAKDRRAAAVLRYNEL